MREVIFGFILIISLIFLVACPEPTASISLCRVNFKYDASKFTNANITNYVIQIRAVPMFGDYNTSGRLDNWTTVLDTAGQFSRDNFEQGEWVFYCRVLIEANDEIEVADEMYTSTISIQDGSEITFTSSLADYDGFGRLGLYIRADRVTENQGLVVRAENLSTGVKYDLTGMEWKKTVKGLSYIDYSYITDEMPSGNWILHIAATDQTDGSEIMSVEEVAVVNAVQEEVTVIKLRSQQYVPGEAEIKVEMKELEGMLIGDTSAKTGEEHVWEYEAMNDYTEENAVWYYWYVDEHRYSSRDPELKYTFTVPGRYVISCAAVGINGEVSKEGCSYITVSVNE
jgi:hypothetical protein